MADVRFVPNTAGFNELRNSPAVQSMCLGYAQRYASAANGSSSFDGASYVADVMAGRTRCHARAKTANEAAWWNEVRGGAGSGPLAHSF